MMDAVEDKTALRKEGANLSGLPPSLSETDQLLYNMCVEVLQKERDRNDATEKEKARNRTMLTHEKQILQKQIFETPVSSSKTVDIPTDSPISSLESLTNKSNASTPSVASSSVTKKAQDNIIDEAMLLQYLNDPPEVAAAKAADIIAATKRQDTLVPHQMAMEREKFESEKQKFEFEFEEQWRMDQMRREAEREAELKELRDFKR